MPFLSTIKVDIHEVEDLMSAQTVGQQTDLAAVLEIVFKAGGKRIRPALAIYTGRMLGADSRRIIKLAASIELLHTATLVHDDLIDGSLLRRGSPTLNSLWSPGATVLTGDFIFARAANLAAQTDSVEVMQIFAATLSTIVNGEISQLLSNRCTLDRESYLKRIYAKTASLFETATHTAALISPVDPDTVESVRRFGYNVGIAFQIVDDILDFIGDESILGKPVGSDLRQGIVTLPTIQFLEDHPDQKDAKAFIESKCDQDSTNIDHLIESIRESDAIQKSLTEARKFTEEGIAALNTLPDTEDRRALEELARYTVSRDL